MITKYNNFINENNQVSNIEEIQQFIDIISIKGPENSKKYIKILKDKYGIDYYDYDNDEYYIKNASLDDIKDKDDFLNYNNYAEYAKKIFRLRNIPLQKDIDKTFTASEVSNIGDILGFKVRVKEYTGFDNYASSDGKVVTIPSKVDVNTVIHEIGHYFDHGYSNEYTGYAKIQTYASSVYGIKNADEVFAENFKHFFTHPKMLKKKIPMVYKELKKKIPSKFKNVINKLI